MKSTAIVCAIVVASLGFGTLAQAEGRGQHRPDDERGSQQDRGGHDNGHSNERNDYRDGRSDGRGNSRSNKNWDGHPANYGARGPDFQRGGHMPQEYRRPIYVVNNYHGHHLPAPRRGQQWVQVGADYVLIAIATGVIAQIILNQ